jgi:hypothetical protein
MVYSSLEPAYKMGFYAVSRRIDSHRTTSSRIQAALDTSVGCSHGIFGRYKALSLSKQLDLKSAAL